MAKIMGLDGKAFEQSFKIGYKIVAVGLAWDTNKEVQETKRNEQKDQIAEAVSALTKEEVRELLN